MNYATILALILSLKTQVLRLQAELSAIQSQSVATSTLATSSPILEQPIYQLPTTTWNPLAHQYVAPTQSAPVLGAAQPVVKPQIPFNQFGLSASSWQNGSSTEFDASLDSYFGSPDTNLTEADLTIESTTYPMNLATHFAKLVLPTIFQPNDRWTIHVETANYWASNQGSISTP